MPLRPLPHRALSSQSQLLRRNVPVSAIRRISSQSRKASGESTGARIGTLVGSAGLGLVVAGFAAWKITSSWKPISLDAYPSTPSHRTPSDPPADIPSTPIITYPSTPKPPPSGPAKPSSPPSLDPPPADPASAPVPPDSTAAHIAAAAGPSHSHAPSDLASSAEATVETAAEEGESQGAFDPRTGEINWDCPCLGGMAHGPCGMQFREAFSCFVFSEVEPKGMDCIDKFKAMQDCFREHPDVYGEELMDDEEPHAAAAEGVADPAAALDTASPPPEPALPSSPTSSESGPGAKSSGEKKLQRP